MSLTDFSLCWRAPFLLKNEREAYPAPPMSAPSRVPDNSIRETVKEKLSTAPVEIDELVRQIGAPAPTILTILLELELAQLVQRHPGARVSWC